VRIIPTVERTRCAICRHEVDLTRTVEWVGVFEPGQGSTPHVCPELALVGWRRRIMLRRWGDPRERKGESYE
jgi:hypothetical protein